MDNAPSLINDQIKALVAIGAAMASNCEPCFKHHYDIARKLGVSQEDMLEAVNTALAVKAAPHRKVVETAQRYLVSGQANAEPASSACGCRTPDCC